MFRFFCTSENLSADKITISNKEEVHHIRDVLRLKREEKVTICDEAGREFECLIESISEKIIFGIKNVHESSVQKQRVKISVGCAIPKKCKFDDIVDKLTQLGVDRIIPIFTERVIVKWDAHKKVLQQKRWEKIALEASKQSKRSILPVIESVKKVEDVLVKSTGYDLKLIPSLVDERRLLKDALAGQADIKNILILIGPEGDFTLGEIALAKCNGFIPITLGENVLRIDTAAIATVSFIKLYENH